MIQPSKTLVVDLQSALERLARTSSVMNIAVAEGIPLRILHTVVKPVVESSQKVHDLLGQALADGVDMDALYVQIHQPMRDSLADLFADVMDRGVPDTPEGLT